MSNKTRFALIVLTISLYLLWISGCWKMVNGFAGSYPYAECWDLKANESKIIQIISEIKQEHPELIPPNETASTIERESWCFVNFYYPDTKEVVHTLLSDSHPQVATISFVGLSNNQTESKPIIDSLTIKLELDTLRVIKSANNYRTINRDFGYFANKRAIKKFEELILDKIEEKLNRSQ